jgi:hypothetical protein
MMDLSGKGGEMSFNNGTWGHLLKLATMNGWEPAGTRKRSREWDGNYWTNDGQRVTDDDARNLADALEEALPDVPDHDALEGKKVRIGNTDEYAIPADVPTTPFEWFSGKAKQRLRDFIVFCRKGGFRIW